MSKRLSKKEIKVQIALGTIPKKELQLRKFIRKYKIIAIKRFMYGLYVIITVLSLPIILGLYSRTAILVTSLAGLVLCASFWGCGKHLDYSTAIIDFKLYNNIEIK